MNTGMSVFAILRRLIIIIIEWQGKDSLRRCGSQSLSGVQKCLSLTMWSQSYGGEWDDFDHSETTSSE